MKMFLRPSHPLLCDIFDDEPESLELFLSQGHSPNMKLVELMEKTHGSFDEIQRQKDLHYANLYHTACYFGASRVMELLQEKQVNVFASNSDEYNAVDFFFLGMGSADVFNLLVEQGFDFNQPMVFNQEPLLFNVLMQILDEQELDENDMIIALKLIRTPHLIDYVNPNGIGIFDLLDNLEENFGNDPIPPLQELLDTARSLKHQKQLDQSTPTVQSSSSTFRL